MEQHLGVCCAMTVALFVLHCQGSGLETRVLLGADAELPCVAPQGAELAAAEWLGATVEWTVTGAGAKKRYVLTYQANRTHVGRPGAQLESSRLLLSDATLRLPNISVSDEGEYICRIIRPLVHTQRRTLRVLARPSVWLPATAAMLEGGEETLQCLVERFYPNSLTVTWGFQNGSQLVPVGASGLGHICTQLPLSNADGTFSLRSTINIQAAAMTDEELQLVCQVEHQSFPEPLIVRTTLMLQAPPPQPRHSTATLVIVSGTVSALIVLMMGGASLLYCFFCTAPPTLSDIMQPPLVYAGVPAELTCTVVGTGLKVKWFRVNAATSEQHSLDSPLLGEDVSGQATLRSDGQRHTAVLTVCLSIGQDRTTYRCLLLDRRGRTTSRETTVHVKVEPASLQISSLPQIPRVERLLVLCCRVEKFYPSDVHLEWFRSDGEPVGAVTHFGPFADHTRLHSVWSRVQLLMAREDERTTFTCRVYHSSLQAPGYRDMLYHINTQGTPPSVMFIDCEPLRPLLEEECTLHLCIKDFCPEDVSVTWTRDGQKLSDGVFNTPPSLNINGLYSMFSFFKLCPQPADCHAQFRCRVVHSALREAEERVFTLPTIHQAPPPQGAEEPSTSLKVAGSIPHSQSEQALPTLESTQAL